MRSIKDLVLLHGEASKRARAQCACVSSDWVNRTFCRVPWSSVNQVWGTHQHLHKQPTMIVFMPILASTFKFFKLIHVWFHVSRVSSLCTLYDNVIGGISVWTFPAVTSAHSLGSEMCSRLSVLTCLKQYTSTKSDEILILILEAFIVRTTLR